MKRYDEKGLPAVALAEAGQTLLEILLAFGVSVMVLSAIILGITTSLSNTQYTKNQNLANSYAQEGMAVVRQIRDSSWYDFSDFTDLEDLLVTNTTYCLDQNSRMPVERSNCGQNVAVIFSREVIFDHYSPSCCPDNTQSCDPIIRGSKATVKVSWADSKCPLGDPFCHKVELISCFSNIDLKLTP